MGLKKMNLAGRSTTLGTALGLWTACGVLAAMTPLAMAGGGDDVGNGMRVTGVDAAEATRSHGTVVDQDGRSREVLFNSMVAVRSAQNWEQLDDKIRSFMSDLDSEGLRFRDEIVSDFRVRFIETQSVAQAMQIATLARQTGLFEDAHVGYTSIPLPDSDAGPVSTERGGGGVFTDPAYFSQWHINGSNSLNVDAVHAAGYTGAGVNIALISASRARFETDNAELTPNFSEELSQEPDVHLDPHPFLTGLASLIAGDENNGVAGAGVAPGATISALVGLTPARENKAYGFKRDDIDIHVIQNSAFYTLFSPDNDHFPDYLLVDDADYHTAVGEAVIDTQMNAFGIARDRKGIAQMFGTGYMGTFFGWANFSNGNVVSYPAGGGYITGPNYMGSRINYHQPAALRQTFVIAPIAANDFILPLSTTGTEIIASAYSSLPLDITLFPDPPTIAFVDFGAGTGGLGTINTSRDGDAHIGFAGEYDTAPAMAGGVVALMLEANPNLSIRDIQHILIDTAVVKPGMAFDPLEIYGFSTHWQNNDANIRHSDEYGFGVIDADAAVTAAIDWPGADRLFALDTGNITEIEDGDIATPDFFEISDVEATIDPTTNPITFFDFCIRQNISVEQIEVDVTLEGDFYDDIMIWIVSPTGTASILHYPNGFAINSHLADLALFNHKFTTYKHWGESAGGRWTLNFRDWGPDEEAPEGDEKDGDIVTDLGPYGLDGNDLRSEKSVASYRIRVFGTDTGEPNFDGCNPLTTNCPGDLNGNGIVDFFDFQIFINWYTTGNALADLNGNGVIEFFDIQLFIAIWEPGFCNQDGGLIGGRPNGLGGGGNDSPIIRPI